MFDSWTNVLIKIIIIKACLKSLGSLPCDPQYALKTAHSWAVQPPFHRRGHSIGFMIVSLAGNMASQQE